MSNCLDHILYAGWDLAELGAWFKTFTGVEPTVGGSHPGLGTRNALASLGEGMYLELIASDPEQDAPGSLGKLFSTFIQPKIYAYMVRAQNLEHVQSLLETVNIKADLVEASRTLPTGASLKWRLLLPRQNDFGECLPKFIDWLDSPHPSIGAAAGCRLSAFEIAHPSSSRLGEIFAMLDLTMPVVKGDRPHFRAELETPTGRVTLNSLA